MIFEKKLFTMLELMPKVPKTLTVPLDLEMLAEFRAAVDILRGRSVASHVHQFIVSQINEARRLVSPEEFARRVEEAREKTMERSQAKKLEAEGRFGFESEAVPTITQGAIVTKGKRSLPGKLGQKPDEKRRAS